MSELNTAGRVALLLGTTLWGPFRAGAPGGSDTTLAIAATGLGALTAILAWRTRA